MEEKLFDKDEALPLPKERTIVILVEQLTRGALHVSQFAVSYCAMLLYMSSNGMSPPSSPLPSSSSFHVNTCLGYIIISILCGALVGFALFTRDTLRPGARG